MGGIPGEVPDEAEDFYALKSENLSPTFQRVSPKNSPPLGGRRLRRELSRTMMGRGTGSTGSL